MPELLEHAAHLTFPAFVDGDAVVEGLHHHRPDGRSVGDAVIQDEPHLQHLSLTGTQARLDTDEILLLMLEAGMGQSVGEVPVVGQKQQPLALFVQATHEVQRHL